jgi:hypothetical protein
VDVDGHQFSERNAVSTFVTSCSITTEMGKYFLELTPKIGVAGSGLQPEVAHREGMSRGASWA